MHILLSEAIRNFNINFKVATKFFYEIIECLLMSIELLINDS